MIIFRQLNDDQLDGLAKLCFDLAKGALLLALFPAYEMLNNLGIVIFRTISALFLGLVFTYMALILLKVKGKQL